MSLGTGAKLPNNAINSSKSGKILEDTELKLEMEPLASDDFGPALPAVMHTLHALPGDSYRRLQHNCAPHTSSVPGIAAHLRSTYPKAEIPCS
eukprot:2962715-Amphidinium_carterae.1